MKASEAGRVWLWGAHSVKAALENPKRKVYKVYTSNAQVPFPASLVQEVPMAYLNSMLPKGVVHQGIAAQVSLLPAQDLNTLDPQKGLVVALDHIIDPHNVGALWRSAAVFGVQAIILTRQHCPPLDGGVAKSACGAMEHVPYVEVSNLCTALSVLKKKGFFCVGLAEEGDSMLSKCTLSPTLLVVGAEDKGLRRLTRESCDAIASIPSRAKFSTLNASVAGALGMYHFSQVHEQQGAFPAGGLHQSFEEAL